jgi:predicted metal-binding membrane protein
MTSDKNELRAFWGIITLLFIASAVITIVWGRSMSAMEEMPMPGGWSMSMMWMPMPGQSWFNTTATFLAMWDVMMLAMMTPCLVPMLLRYRKAVEQTSVRRLDWLTTLTGLGYFFVWTIIGLIVFLLGVKLNAILMQYKQLSLIVPVAVGIVILIVGLLQFTNWKLHQLTCCRALPFGGQTAPANTSSALKHGLRLGIQCSRCSAGLMSILLVVGMMNLFAMAIVTAAITGERLAPASKWVTGTIGAVSIGAGFFLIAQTVRIFSL